MPLSPMGRLADSHPMRREETLVKRPEKTLGPKTKEEWREGICWDDMLREPRAMFRGKGYGMSQSHSSKILNTGRPGVAENFIWYES